MEKLKYAPMGFTIKAVDPLKFQIQGVFSTDAEDRHGEIIDQNGWKLDNFLKNPVILWAHDQTQPAIGKSISIGLVAGQLEGTIQFAADEYEFAKTIFNLYKGEYLRAFSVGFMNTKWLFDEQKDTITLLENELYEISCVNVPANAMALAKSKGLDVGPLEKRMDRTEKMNTALLNKKDEAAVETTPEKEEKPANEVPNKDEPETPPKDPAEEDPEKGKKEETPAPAKTDDTQTPDEVKAALEVLCKSDTKFIKDAVKELTSRLNASEADNKESEVEATPDAPGRKKRYSNADINRVIRSLLNSKRI